MPDEHILVEIFSDVVCPWCAVGKRRFETAMRRFEHADEIDVVWRAYELDPHAPTLREGDDTDRLVKKLGTTREQVVASRERLTAIAKDEGLDFHFEQVRSGNTFDAHRLLHYALVAGPGMQDLFKERLLVAYFSEGAAIGEHETLQRLAVDVGLNGQECADILADTRYAEEVRADEREALEIGVTGVPFFVVDRKFGIPGAQDPDTILSVLQRAWRDANPLEMAVVPRYGTAGDAVCDGDSCDI